MISAKVIADSKNESGNRITTMIITLPRIILAELNTHRMLSKNSASSRAIPFKKMLKSVKENPFIPIAWQKDHKGMQGGEYIIDKAKIDIRRKNWLRGLDRMILTAEGLHANIMADGGITIDIDGEGVTKQLCNRLLEPFMWHTVIVTATEWENFFALRCPKYKVVDGLNGANAGLTYYRSWKDLVKKEALGLTTKQFLENMSLLERLQKNSGQAEIHMMALAEAMWDAYNESTPKELQDGEWHIPFGDNIDLPTELVKAEQQISTGLNQTITNLQIKIATARCARVSYTVVGEEDKKLVQEITDKNIAEGKGHKWESVDYQLKEQKQYENDIKLHDRLAESGHWSPFEHCAQVNKYLDSIWSGNFRGFIQYRKTFHNENIEQKLGKSF